VWVRLEGCRAQCVITPSNRERQAHILRLCRPTQRLVTPWANSHIIPTAGGTRERQAQILRLCRPTVTPWANSHIIPTAGSTIPPFQLCAGPQSRFILYFSIPDLLVLHVSSNLLCSALFCHEFRLADRVTLWRGSTLSVSGYQQS
jgi:hypothetical protein